MVLNRDLGRPSRALVAMLILLGLSIFINYIDRGNLGTAASLIKNEFHLSPLSRADWRYATNLA